MTRPFYQKLDWGHYHRDTRHLRDAREHGAYLLLIGALFCAGGRLKADDELLARHACCTSQEWAQLKPIILPFFKLARGWLSHKRVSADLAEITDTRQKRKASGRAGGLASRGKYRGSGQAPAEAGAAAPAQAKPTEKQKQSQSEKPSPDGEGAATAAPAADKPGRRRPSKICPPDWSPSAADLAIAELEGLTEPEIAREMAKFRDHQFTTAKTHWSATFRNWVREAAERKHRNVQRLDHDPRRLRTDANHAAALAGADLAARRGGKP